MQFLKSFFFYMGIVLKVFDEFDIINNTVYTVSVVAFTNKYIGVNDGLCTSVTIMERTIELNLCQAWHSLWVDYCRPNILEGNE